MAQTLIQANGEKQLVDREFVEPPMPPIFSVHGGQKVMIDQGQAGKPTIRQHGKSFFYENGEPVRTEEHVAHLPEPYRTQALAFVRAQQAKPEPVTLKRRGGRPPKAVAQSKKKAGVQVTHVPFKAEDALGAEAHRPARAE